MFLNPKSESPSCFSSPRQGGIVEVKIMGVSAKKSSKGTSMEATNSQVKKHTDAASVKSKKRSGDEIDEIFSSKKNKKTKVADSLKGKNVENKKKSTDDKEKIVKRSNKLPADGDLFGDSSKPRKNTSGLKIYTEEELGLNKPDAGGTPLCPFDCECCF